MVGGIVYQAASKNLVPVTLELGGKSPTIVDETVNLDIAARRIIFGKLINAGQTCIAPDYLYVKSGVHDELVKSLVKAIESFYPNFKDMGHMVNERHFLRLKSLIDEEKVLYGGQTNKENNFISPTLLKNVDWDDDVMKEEIFGPILPILKYDDIEDLIKLLKTKEKTTCIISFFKR